MYQLPILYLAQFVVYSTTKLDEENNYSYHMLSVQVNCMIREQTYHQPSRRCDQGREGQALPS